MASITLPGWTVEQSRACRGLNRAWRWIRLLGILYALGCILYVLRDIMGVGALPADVRTPYVIGMQESSATRLLQARGFKIHVEVGGRSDGYPPDAVMEQSLPAGMAVRQGRTIYLQVCAGHLHVILPNVRNLPSSEALDALFKAGLDPAIASDVQSASVPFDNVIEQLPAPGSRVEFGSGVALILSDGAPENLLGSDGSDVQEGAAGAADPDSLGRLPASTTSPSSPGADTPATSGPAPVSPDSGNAAPAAPSGTLSEGGSSSVPSPSPPPVTATGAPIPDPLAAAAAQMGMSAPPPSAADASTGADRRPVRTAPSGNANLPKQGDARWRQNPG